MSVRPAGDFKTSYVQDMAILDKRSSRLGFAVLVAGLLLAPWWAGRFIFLLNTNGISAVRACGLGLLTGFTGQISLGHAAFMAIGAYSSAFLSQALRFPFLIALPVTSLITFLFGVVVGLPSLRIKGLYLAIATLAFQFLTEYALIHAYAGIAESLWAHYNRLITTKQFNIVASIDYVTMIVIGGLTSAWGPHLGSAFVWSLSQGLQIFTPAVLAVFPAFGKIATPLREIVFGVTLIALLIWEPGGLAMLLRKLKRKLDLWPFAY